MEQGTSRCNVQKVSLLMEVYEDIRATLHGVQPQLKAMHAARSVESGHVFALAERLSYSAFALDGWKEGFPLFNKYPPAPQPEQMHSGKLTDYNQAMRTQQNDLSTSLNEDASQVVDLAFVNALASKAHSWMNKPSEVAQSLQSLTTMQVDNREEEEGVGGDKDSREEVVQPSKKARTRVSLTFNVTDSDSD